MDTENQNIKISISTRIPADLYEKIKSEADKQRRSMAQVIEICLSDNFKDKKSKGVK